MPDSDITFKRGESLFAEGDAIDHVYMVKSGRVKLVVERGGKRIELFDANKGQLLHQEASDQTLL